ncbi:alpha/beta fold hydrolase [Nocardioides alcanivorans]|uniref:alpha/beta fold hydrolase n=1 Tax=Nocardioides alcanivorans TaxID=2897352 RepID=UPI001F28CFF9|nr:alpha/beta fold hydrolase [Nocardioides alcanivorans]
MQTFDGLELHVRTYGRTDADVTVVLAHCWTADVEDWHYQVHDLLAEYGHEIRIVTWDHRGHGKSDPAPRDACTVHNLGRDMADVIDGHAPTGRLVLAGHSIGGMTMMALAEQRPDIMDRVAGALFCATSAADLDTVNLGMPEMGRFAKAQIPLILAQRACLNLAAPAVGCRWSSATSCAASSSGDRCAPVTPVWWSTRSSSVRPPPWRVSCATCSTTTTGSRHSRHTTTSPRSCSWATTTCSPLPARTQDRRQHPRRPPHHPARRGPHADAGARRDGVGRTHLVGEEGSGRSRHQRAPITSHHELGDQWIGADHLGDHGRPVQSRFPRQPGRETAPREQVRRHRNPRAGPGHPAYVGHRLGQTAARTR